MLVLFAILFTIKLYGRINIFNLLFNKSYMKHEMNRIQSRNHKIGSYRINKICLSSYDDKKYILKDGYSKLSHFHKFTR